MAKLSFKILKIHFPDPGQRSYVGAWATGLLSRSASSKSTPGAVYLTSGPVETAASADPRSRGPREVPINFKKLSHVSLCGYNFRIFGPKSKIGCLFIDVDYIVIRVQFGRENAV